jgi:hypothetical protein
MICKYFKGGKSGGAVEYLLNERVEQGTSTLLRGDPQLTKQLIENSNNTLKYRSGCLSFEEANLSQKEKDEIMDLFESSTFAGLEREQYNILWVEHVDKGRLELNFVIPRVELTSGKSFNPHWHKEDQTRLLKFQDYVNSKYSLSNPFDSDKRQTLQVDTKQLNRNDLKEHIHSIVEEQIIAQKLQNRDEVIQFFKDSGIEVTRATNKSITILAENTKIRLEGIYYEKTFTSVGAVAENISRAEREHIPTSQRQLTELKQELDRLIQYKANTNRERYPKIERNNDREHRLRTRDIEKEQVVQVRHNSNDKLHVRNTPNMVSNEEQNAVVESAKRTTSGAEQRKIYLSTSEQAHKQQQQPQHKIYQDRGVSDDGIRKEIDEITRRREGRVEQRKKSNDFLSGINSQILGGNKQAEQRNNILVKDIKPSFGARARHFISKVFTERLRDYTQRAVLSIQERVSALTKGVILSVKAQRMAEKEHEFKTLKSLHEKDLNGAIRILNQGYTNQYERIALLELQSLKLEVSQVKTLKELKELDVDNKIEKSFKQAEQRQERSQSRSHGYSMGR